MQPSLQWKSNKYYTTRVRVCVFVALGIQHAMRMCLIIICGLSRFTMFPHYLINGTIFGGGGLNNVFWFSLQLLSEKFLIPRRNERDMIKMCIGLHVKYRLFLYDVTVTWIFSTDFRKIMKYQISWKSVQWEPSCSMRTDGHEANNRFSNFANAPENKTIMPYRLCIFCCFIRIKFIRFMFS